MYPWNSRGAHKLARIPPLQTKNHELLQINVGKCDRGGKQWDEDWEHTASTHTAKEKTKKEIKFVKKTKRQIVTYQTCR